MNSLIHVIKNESPDDEKNKYAVVVNIRLLDIDDKIMKTGIERFVTSAQQHINKQHGIQLRPFIERNPQNDRRLQNQSYFSRNRRTVNRQRSNQKLLIFEAMFDPDSISSTEHHSGPLD